MIDIQELNEKFSIPGTIAFNKPENKLIQLTVSNGLADAVICLYGAQILSFRPKNGPDLLWMSPLSYFESGRAIRGGIPICFPWFGPHKSNTQKPQHGFGRLMSWNVVETAELLTGETVIRLELCSSDATIPFWPHDFCAQLSVLVGKTLEVTLKVANISSLPFDYSCALHTYYNVSAIENISISGLGQTHYLKNDEPGDFIQEDQLLEIHQLEDRHYYNTEATCIIDDPIFKRKVRVEKSGSKVTTVWNPWAENCAKISDMPDDGYKSFVCIEAVNSLDNTIYLNPGESHETTAIIGLED